MVKNKVSKKKEAKKAPKNITTKEDFDFACKEFMKWVVRFGLTDWEILFLHKLITSEGRVDLFQDDKIAHFYISTDWADHKVNKESLTDTARHEAIHLVLANLDHLCRHRYVTEKELDVAVEDTTRRICRGVGSIIEEIKDDKVK